MELSVVPAVVMIRPEHIFPNYHFSIIKQLQIQFFDGHPTCFFGVGVHQTMTLKRVSELIP
jgi:hypothetical protein